MITECKQCLPERMCFNFCTKYPEKGRIIFDRTGEHEHKKSHNDIPIVKCPVRKTPVELFRANEGQ